jgi:hypothetical protein
MDFAAAPLYALRQMGITWNWTDLKQTAFVKAKQLMAHVGSRLSGAYENLT